MKTIINEKLYDTDTAELVAVGNYIEVYQTQKGNWFKKSDSMLGWGCMLIPIEVNEAKKLIGLHAPEKYERYFGQAEEA